MFLPLVKKKIIKKTFNFFCFTVAKLAIVVQKCSCYSLEL